MHAWRSNDVAAFPANVDVGPDVDPIRGRSGEIEMATAPSANLDGCREVQVRRSGFSLGTIDIDDSEAAASDDADVRLGPPSPPLRDLFDISGGGFEAGRCPRMLSGFRAHRPTAGATVRRRFVNREDPKSPESKIYNGLHNI